MVRKILTALTVATALFFAGAYGASHDVQPHRMPFEMHASDS